MSVLRDKYILQTMRGVLRYYEGRVGRDRINPSPPQTNQLRSQARWTYLNLRGHHPYVPYVSHHHLNSNRGGFAPWIDAPPRNDPQSRSVTVCVTNQPSTNHPVGRVRPRIRVPDSRHYHQKRDYNSVCCFTCQTRKAHREKFRPFFRF